MANKKTQKNPRKKPQWGFVKYATLVEPGNAEMISRSVKDIISNYAKYNEIASIGREYIIDNFNWIKISNEYENIIYKTIENFRNANI